jgi:hypothetical protein
MASMEGVSHTVQLHLGTRLDNLFKKRVALRNVE